MPYAPERAAAESAARAAAAWIRAHAGGLSADAVRTKGLHDLVSFVDEGAQRIVVDHLRNAFPDDAVLAEEDAPAEPGSARGSARGSTPGRRWVVDPLDGTTNFVHGVPPYAVSIALEEDGQGVVGVVLEVTSGELFSAARGTGLTVNGAPAGVSETTTLEAALLATGFPFRDYRALDGYLATFERAVRSARGVRRHGAAAVDLAWTAAGRFDGFFEAGLAPWDVAAGRVLVEAGGGTVTGLWDGGDPVYSGGVVATNGRLHDAVGALAEPLSAAVRNAGATGRPTDSQSGAAVKSSR